MNTNRLIRWLIFAVLVLSFSAASFAQVFISVRFGPPALPIYAQPICPGPGYLWTPGYWAWDDDAGYYWVPGTWVLAPVGLLWTPGYWGFANGFYLWHPGYWGPHVGFYGGINYGFGYTGVGFFGGEWRGDRFFYNRSVTNINVVNVTNVYERRVVVHNDTRVSFNGGSGGIKARPTRDEERFARESHREELADQREHQRAASHDRSLFASENRGRPAVAATGRPGEFRGREVVGAREAGGRYEEPRMSPREAREGRGPETRRETRNETRPETRNDRRNENRREEVRSDRPQNRPEARPERQEQRSQTKQERQQQQREEKQRVQQEKADRQRVQQEQRPQTRQDRKQQQREEKQRVQQEKADRKRAQQDEKRQQKEDKKRDRRDSDR